MILFAFLNRKIFFICFIEKALPKLKIVHKKLKIQNIVLFEGD